MNTVDEDPDVQNAIKEGKGKIYNPSLTLPRSKPGHMFLYKELYRRSVINSKDDSVVKLKKKMKQEELIDQLIKLPPNPSEIPYIVALWNWFVQDCKDRYLAKSGGDEAKLLQQLREVECILHPSLRDDFKLRNHQKERHELDAINSNKLPPNYYDKVASLYNSDIEFESVYLGTTYGKPFDKVYTLKKFDKTVTGAEIKQRVTGWKRAFLKLTASINASGSGNDDHRGSEVHNFINTNLSVDGKVVSYGHNVGYAFVRCAEEGVIDEIMAVLPDQFAGTMNNVFEININDNDNSSNKKAERKRGTNTHSASSKKKRGDGSAKDSFAQVKLNLGHKLMNQMARSDINARIESIDIRIQANQQIAIQLKEERRKCVTFIWKCEERAASKGVDAETDDAVIEAQEDLKACKSKITENENELKLLQEEKAQLKLDQDNVNNSVAEGVGEGAALCNEQADHARRIEAFKSSRTFDVQPNNGSDDELDPDYTPEEIEEV